MSSSPIALSVSTLRYSSSLPPALSEVQLEFRPGESVLILGPSGSGKTTLLHCLSGALPFLGRYRGCGLDGELRYGGTAIDRTNITGLWRRCGLLFQYPDHNFVTTTVLDELLLAARIAGVSQALAAERIGEAARSLRLAGLLHSRVDELSDGTKQLVALAGLFVRRPEYLFLDEPTAMLDPENRARVVEGILAYQSAVPGSIVFVTSHDAGLVTGLGASRCLMVEQGRVSETSCEEISIPWQDGEDSAGADDAGPFGSGSSIVTAELLGLYYKDPKECVVAGLNFGIQEGVATLLTGPNASGKTTLCRALSGLHRRFHGMLAFKDRNYTDEPPRAPSEVAHIAQLPTTQFIEESVEKELRLAAPGNEDGDYILETAQSYLEAFDVQLDADPLALSFGQQKLVNLLSFLNWPELLVIDEPVVCLDTDQRTAVLELLTLYLRNGSTLAIATHWPEAFSSLEPGLIPVQ